MQKDVYRTCRPLRSLAWRGRTHLSLAKTLVLLLFICLGSLSHTVLAQDWAQQGTDINGVANEGLGIGVCLSADGTIMAIGTNTNDLNPGNSKSSVKVREWNGTAWVQKGSTLYAEQSGDNFGFSVNLSADGTVLAVGAHTFSDIPSFGEFSFSGKVYVYDWSGTDWVLRGTALNGGAAQENFGNSISLSQDGDLLAVGAPGANAGGTLRGITRVYEWNGTSWGQVGSNIAGDTDFENCGTSVSLKVAGAETILAVGSPTYTPGVGEDYVGRVKIFNRSGNSWGLSKTLDGSNIGDYFGYSVSLSNNGDRIAIGAPTDGLFSANFIGYARTFDYTGSDWTQSGSDIVSDLVFDMFGDKLALSGDGQSLIIGARGGTGNENGRAEVYEFNASAWQQKGNDIIGEAENDLFGVAVAINQDGSLIAISGSDNDGGGVSAGYVQTYTPGCTPPAAPTGTATQEFCSGATVAQLAATGTDIQWYDAASGGTLLNSTTTLTNSTIYYASQTVSACESTDRLAVTVTVNTTAAPTGDATQSFCAAATVAELTATGTDIKWYDAATDGNLLDGSTALVAGSSYYASQTVGGCESTARFAVEVASNTVDSPTASSTQSFCNEATVAELEANGTDIKWYDAESAGSLLDGSIVLVHGTTYYASQTVDGCESTSRLAVTADIFVMPVPTGDAAQVFCEGATVADLSATGIEGTVIKWYSEAAGGSVVDNATALTDGTAYYAVLAFGACESASRLAVTAAVNASPTAPTGDAAQAFCNSATVADLVAAGTDIKWYDAETEGNLLGSTDEIVSGTKYYASQTLGGCESARLEVTATVTIAAAPTSAGDQLFCNEATVADLTATGTGIKWYDVAMGGTPLSGTQQLQTNVELAFFASQTVNGCESTERLSVAAGVYLIEAPTGNATQVFCGTATIADLVATPMNAAEIIWYADATGGTALEATTTLVNGTKYYAEQLFSTFCPSVSRLEVTVTINSTPAIPTGNAVQSFCNAATIADLVATGTSVTWYAAASGGSPLENTTDLVSGTKYYASQTIGGCESARLEVTATVNMTPAPTVNGTVQLICNEGTIADLVATGTDIKWYEEAEGGTPLSGSTPVANADYFASQTLNGCESATRVKLIASILVVSAPTGDATQVFCEGATIANLTAAGGSGSEIKWYSEATGGTLLSGTTTLVNGTTYFAGQSFAGLSCSSEDRLAVTVELLALPEAPVSEVIQPTCSLATGTITITAQNSGETYSFNNGVDYQEENSLAGLAAGEYQIVIKNEDGCASPAATVTVNAQPPTPGTPIATVTQPTCEVRTGTVTVTIQQAGDTYSFNNGTDYQSSNIKSGLEPGEYQVIIKSEDGCTSVVTTSTVDTPPAIPDAPTGNETQNFCGEGTVAQLTATGTSIKWYAAETGGTPLATNTALTANTTYYASQTVDCESTSRLAVMVTLIKCDQTITFGELPAKTFGDDPITLEATTTSQLAITYTSSNTNVATIDGDQLTIVGAGTTTITASQDGNANYNAAAVERSLTVNKASQSVSGFDLPATHDLATGSSLTLSATAPSGQVTFSSSNTSVATVDGNTLNLVAPGSVTITALAAETDNYLAASATETIEVTDSRATLEIEEIDFGMLLRLETQTLSITVQNLGPGTATITNATVPAGFSVTPTSFVLGGGSSRELSITFSPTIVKDYSGTLTLTTNAMNNTKPITGECVYITELEQGADSNTMAYPNPGNGMYTISGLYEKQVTIITSAGVALQREAHEVAPRLMNLDLTDMPNGLYVLRLHGQGKTTTVKVIKK